ncbi:hypothetical protein GCK32_003456 [Trichostrongylus colubriformis]|uniref:Uncharacterized protein n=1 Tax=Trichostrongylus colubriformis TaxID=6319 RepID=A0AAN8FZ77_TRICO
MESIALIFLFHPIASQHQACFLKCKDNYMHGMQSSLAEVSSDWSADVVSPLQALLSQTTTHAQMSFHMESACRLNTAYQNCLSQCPENPAKRILQSGQESWNIICYDFRNDTEFRDVVLRCWSTMGFKLAEQCATISHLLQAEIAQLMAWGLENMNKRMESLCRSVYAYDSCLVDKNYEFCGLKAGRFLVKLTHQTSHALFELLTDVLGMTALPQSCKEWLNLKDIKGPRPRATARRMRNNGMMRSSHFLIVLAILQLVIFSYC